MKAIIKTDETGIVIMVLANRYCTAKSLEPYLNTVAQFTLSHYVRAIIVMGQYHDATPIPKRHILRELPKTVGHYLHQQGVVVPVFQAAGLKSLSGNLMVAKNILTKNKIDTDEMVIFPGEFSPLMTRLVARRILGFWPNLETSRPTKVENTKKSLSSLQHATQ